MAYFILSLWTYSKCLSIILINFYACSILRELFGFIIPIYLSRYKMFSYNILSSSSLGYGILLWLLLNTSENISN